MFERFSNFFQIVFIKITQGYITMEEGDIITDIFENIVVLKKPDSFLKNRNGLIEIILLKSVNS